MHVDLTIKWFKMGRGLFIYYMQEDRTFPHFHIYDIFTYHPTTHHSIINLTNNLHQIIIPYYTMSKQPPRTKRKTSSYAAAEEESCLNQLFANLDLSDKSTTPKVVAKALLSLLPDDSTKHDPTSAKKLVSP